jgi:TfoX/Sxy family transcriptional regulator of competence genes
MAYNETLSKRIAALLLKQNTLFLEKKMFGGLAFMINDKMCIGVMKNELMLRVMDETYHQILKLKYAKPMEFTGRTMKGFVLIDEKGLTDDDTLMEWIAYGIEFGKYGIVKSKTKNPKK